MEITKYDTSRQLIGNYGILTERERTSGIA